MSSSVAASVGSSRRQRRRQVVAVRLYVRVEDRLSRDGFISTTWMSLGIPVAEWQRLRRCHIAYLPQSLRFPGAYRFGEHTPQGVFGLRRAGKSGLPGGWKELGIDSRADYPVGPRVDRPAAAWPSSASASLSISLSSTSL